MTATTDHTDLKIALAILIPAGLLAIGAIQFVDGQPAPPEIPNCTAGFHLELIGQDFTCVRDIPGQQGKLVLNPNEQRCIGCVNEPSPGIEGLKPSQLPEVHDPYQVKPGEGPTDEQHCIGCTADMEAPPSNIEDTNLPELKK